jgi:hypothetical protein
MLPNLKSCPFCGGPISKQSKRQCMKCWKSGNGSQWKGDNAGYSGFHVRVDRLRGKPKRCESCGLSDENRKYHWANLTGNYSDVWDYKRLCVSCHRKYDYARVKVVNPNALKRKQCKRGHLLSEDNVYQYGAFRLCKICHRERSNQWKRNKRAKIRALKTAKYSKSG